MQLRHLFILIIMIFTELFISACVGNKATTKDCPWKEGKSIYFLFTPRLIDVVHCTPPASYGIEDWRDSHSKDNTYFTTRVDYRSIGDTIFCRKIDLAATTDNDLIRIYLNPIPEKNKAFLKKLSVQKQNELLRFGWIDNLVDADTSSFLETQRLEVQKFSPQLKSLLELGTLSYYYRKDTLEYIEGKIRQKGKNKTKYAQFLLGKDYVYIFLLDSLIVPSPEPEKHQSSDIPPLIVDGHVVIEGSRTIQKPVQMVGCKYLFKDQKLVAFLTKKGKDVCSLTKAQTTKGNKLMEYYYKPLLSLTNAN